MLNRKLDVIVWAILGGLAIASIGLSFWGWFQFETGRQTEMTAGVWLDIAARTISFFFAERPDVDIPGTGVAVPPGYISLNIARVLAPTATMGAILRVAIEFFFGQIRASRVRNMKGHTVVSGLSDNGLAFARSEAAMGRKVVIVGPEENSSAAFLGSLHGFEFVLGDPREIEVLRAAGVGEARNLVSVLPDDGDNLEVAMLARKIVEKDRKAAEPLLVNVAIANRRLWRQIVRSDAIERSHGKFEMLPFNLAIWAARQFTWREPLWGYAALRGQKKIHAVFIGFDEYAEAMIGQIPPACVAGDLERPAFSILTGQEKFARGSLAQSYDQLAEVCDITYHHFEPRMFSLTETLMETVSEVGEVTAVFVCLDDEEESLGAAIHVQDVMHRTGQWGAPVYLRLAKCEGVGDLLVDSARARRFSEVIQPFGVEDELCSLDAVEGRLEKLARAIHVAYEASRDASVFIDDPERSSATLSDWRSLPETFRVSNRRAADNIQAKLWSCGSYVPVGTKLDACKGFQMASSPAVLEELAELEHRSWVAGRYVDGWQYGDHRDDRRKRHPNMVAYSELDEPTKEFDRDQIHLIDKTLINRPDNAPSNELIRVDHWIGLIGKNLVHAEEVPWIKEQCTAFLSTFVEKRPDCHVTLVTPLAPGSDFILASGALAYLKEKGVPHRLLVVAAVPSEHMIEDYRENFENGGVWDGEDSVRSDKSWTGGDGDGQRDLIRKHRDKIIASEATEWVIDLTDAEADYREQTSRQAGYRTAADYIATRAHTLIAVHRPEPGDRGAKMGGTEDTLRRRPDLLVRRPDTIYRNVVFDLQACGVSEDDL